MMMMETTTPIRDWASHLAGKIARWLPFVAQGCHATIDFETRSACDLATHGSWIYSKHPTTQAMCLSYRLPGDKEAGIPVRRWHRAHPNVGVQESPLPEDLFAWILAGGAVEAHNAFFERVIWRNVCHARYGWPAMPSRQWRCSAARASACALPRDLAMACSAMGLAIGKDMEGRKLMLKMSKPRKARKDEVAAWKAAWGDTPMGLLWHEDPADLERLWAYCDRDVEAEEAFSDAVPELRPEELALWQINQELNERGTRFDLDFARAALKAAEEWKKVLNQELFEMTGITSATQRAVVRAWLKSHEGVDLPDTTGEVVDFYLARVEMSGRAKRVLEILKQVNRTSIRKFNAMLKMVDPEDGRARDLLMWHGANTGRDSGKGIQVHNFPRGKSKNAWNKKGKAFFDMDRAVEDTMTGDVEWMAAMAGDVMEMLSSALRGAVIPADGRDLIVADYAAIEARCLLWEACATDALAIFNRTDTDIYCDMATGIYGFEVKKNEHPNERQFGKQAVLGLGYGMGFITFLLTCRKYEISFTVEQVKAILKEHYDKYMEWVENYLFPKPKLNPTAEQQKKDVARMREAAKIRYRLIEKREDPKAIIHELALMKYTVDVYRSRYPEVKAMWSGLEDAAIAAVQAWDKMVQEGLDDLLENREWLATPEGTAWRDKIEGPTFEVAETGGKVAYFVKGGFLCCRLPSGRLLRYRNPEVKPTKTSWGEVKPGLRYWTIVTGNKWARTHTYGGKLAENVTQAVARDIMMDAVRRAAGYKGYTVEGNVITIQWGPKSVYDVNFSVHDELLAEVDKDKGSVEEFEDLMSETEEWADGCPILAEGKRFPRYRK